jgi:hypothetical protein
MIDPLLLLMTVLGIAATFAVMSKFSPGLPRRALVALIVAVFMVPKLVVGHGIGITAASLLLLIPTRPDYWKEGAISYSLVPMLVVWLVALSGSSAAAWFSRSRLASKPPASVAARRREKIISVAAHLAFAALVAASTAYRAYAREFQTTYGPFVVTVETEGRPLKDIVTSLSCQLYPNHYETAVVRSGEPHEFPKRYMPRVGKEIDCRVSVVHPDLAPNIHIEYARIPVEPRTRISIPTIHAPPWSDARYRRIARGEEVPPGSDVVPPLRRAEIAVYDDWIDLSIRWVPAFCTTDFPRIQREYLSHLAARRNAIFLNAGALPPQDDPSAIVLAGWNSSCEHHTKKAGP